MKALKVMAKLMTLCLGILSLVAVAETYYDKMFYTASFMDDVQDVELRVKPKKDDRKLASFQKDLPKIQEVKMNKKDLVDGKWQITRIINDQGNTEYDFYNNFEDNGDEIITELELMSKSVVRLDNDDLQIYWVSLLNENGTIALFKEYGESFEIVEARRVKQDTDQITPVEEVEPQEKERHNSKYDIMEDLYIVSALDPQKNKNVLKGREVEGTAYLKNGLLTIDAAQIHIGSKHQTETVSISSVNIKKHGTFNDDEGNQGIVTNVTKDEMKVRFSTGVLAGAMLNFATYNKKVELEEKFAKMPPPRLPVEQAAPAQERQQAPVNAQYEQAQTYDEVVEERGYEDNFDSYSDDPYREESQDDYYEEEYQENYQEDYQEQGYDDEYQEEAYADEYRDDFRDVEQEDRFREIHTTMKA